MKERLIVMPLWGRAEPTPDENGIWLPWLVRLRWVALCPACRPFFAFAYCGVRGSYSFLGVSCWG